ncbi:conserved hypothetical protein [Vibrio chagasii]|nr:conserved hypothetical protein [Vibrio chagasii]CAH6922830.1 conserved hypothetical protein [Vibrio chagasii]CAH6953606.1 conserved hypothetical protein [Vibrio chagasii]CAH7116319.1 conserved hypothetical protein [Vibrio chagasii]CAH7252923.1 conserved hypothetical protein [Vibrio chagasii]
MESKNFRISNMARSELAEIWKYYDTDSINQLLTQSNAQEIEVLVGHLSETGIQIVFDGFNAEAANKVFSSLPRRMVNKVLLLCNSNTLSKLPRLLERQILMRVIKSTSTEVTNRLLKTLPVDERRMLQEITEEESELDSNYKHYLSEKFENSIEKESLMRIKELEERERYLERRQRAREEQFAEQLEYLRSQIATTEKEFHVRQNKLKSIEASYIKKENELKDNIRVLQEEHQKQVQEKIEIKVPEFVNKAVETLKVKEKEFSDKSSDWNKQGMFALGAAIVSAVGGLIYGGFEFNSAAKDNIDWFFFSFLLLKGLIVVTLFGAWAKHAYSIGNAYMHESLKRSDRMHAINFGKLYLEVYGNDVSQADMKAIFENWNLDSDSAFTKIKPTNFEPKVVEQVTQMINAVSKASPQDNGVQKAK